MARRKKQIQNAGNVLPKTASECCNTPTGVLDNEVRKFLDYTLESVIDKAWKNDYTCSSRTRGKIENYGLSERHANAGQCYRRYVVYVIKQSDINAVTVIEPRVSAIESFQGYLKTRRIFLSSRIADVRVDRKLEDAVLSRRALIRRRNIAWYRLHRNVYASTIELK